MTASLATDVAWRFRHDQRQMSARMVRDLRRVWPALDFGRLDATYPVWSYSVEQVVGHYETQSIARSQAYLETFYRDQGISGRPIPFVAPPSAPHSQIDSLLHSQAVATIKSSTAAGASASMTMDQVLSTTSLSMVRVVRDGARDYVRQTALADPRLGGWARVGTGDTCAFCQMLIGRGAVYNKGSVRFASHLNCNCEAVPAYGDQAKPVEEYRRSDRTVAFKDKEARANKERVARWLEVHEVG